MPEHNALYRRDASGAAGFKKLSVHYYPVVVKSARFRGGYRLVTHMAGALNNRTGIIADLDLLSGENPPAHLAGREEQERRLRLCLAPMERGSRPLSAWLYGPPGTGKTVLARRVVADVCSGGSRVGVYVNCWEHRSLYGILQAIIGELKILGAEVQDTKLKLDRVRQTLQGRTTVVVLDEIDRIASGERDSAVYALLTLPKTGLICVANGTAALARLDGRVRSRLAPVLIELAAYSRATLAEILNGLAQRALLSGTCSPAVIGRVAQAADGDARLAIGILAKAAIEADEAGQRMLDSGSIDRELKCWHEVCREARWAGLSEHEKILARLAAQHALISTVRLRELYVASCHERGIPPLARRTFSKCVNRLVAADLLRITSRPGARGRRLAYVSDT